MNKGIFLVILATLQWGALGIFIKKIEGMSADGIIISRLLIGSFYLFTILMLNKKYRQQLIKSVKNIKFYLIISVVMSAHFLLGTFGYIHTTIANASLLTNTMPIFVPILAVIFLKEEVNKKEILGIFIAFTGVIIIFLLKGISFESEYFLGNVFAIISAILLAIYTIISGKYKQKYSPLITMFWMCLLGAIILFVYHITFYDDALFIVTNNNLYNLLGLSLVGTFGHLAYFASLKYIKTITASAIAMCSPIIAMIYANIFLLETYTFMNILGIIITLLGISVTVFYGQIKSAVHKRL